MFLQINVYESTWLVSKSYIFANISFRCDKDIHNRIDNKRYVIINCNIIIFTFAFYGILQILFFQNPITKCWLMGEAFVLLLVSWGFCMLVGVNFGYVKLCYKNTVSLVCANLDCDNKIRFRPTSSLWQYKTHFFAK